VRVRPSLILLGAVLASATLLAAASGGTFSGTNGLIAFTCNTTQICTATDGTVYGNPLVSSGKDPAWSPNGARLAYEKGSDVYLANADGSGEALLRANASDPTWGGNTTVAYVVGGDVWVRDLGAGTESQLALTATNSIEPSYSSTGAQIAFASESAGVFHIWSANSDGSSETQLTSGSGREPSWSPDGTKVAFTNGAGHIATVTAAAPYTEVDLGVAGSAPSFSPDGTKISYVTSGSALGVMNADGSNAHTVSGTGFLAVADTDWGVAQPPSSGSGGGNTGSGPRTLSYPTIAYASGDSSPVVGHTLTASVGSWSGTFPITYTYRWKRCEPSDPVNGTCVDIANATSSSFTPTSNDYGFRLRVAVTAKDSNGSTTQNSEVTAPTQAIAPRNTATPQITPGPGAVVDTPLTLTAGVWSGSTPLAMKYDWRRCNPPGEISSCVSIIGATTATYTPNIGDIGFTLRVWITGSNVAGSDVAITNHTFPVVDKQHFAPSVQTAPAIAGTPLPGRQLTANIGAFKGDAPIETRYQWYRCDATGEACHGIRGAAKVTYHPCDADVGFTLRLFVFVSNPYGKLLAKSDPTDAIAATPPNIPGRRIVGSARGEYLAGGGHDDTILGMGGNDTVLGGAGDDRLDGGRGNDVITGGAGADRIFGGLGSDSITSDDGERDIVDCGDGRDRVVADPYDLVGKSCEVVVRRGPGV
jgi:hypothetical protein